MTKLPIIICIAFMAQLAQAVDYTNAPAYYNALDFFVFTDGTVASNALAAVDASGWFAPKGATATWDTLQKTLDGKFVFRRIPTMLIGSRKVPAAEWEAWLKKYNPTIEQYSAAWFKPPVSNIPPSPPPAYDSGKTSDVILSK